MIAPNPRPTSDSPAALGSGTEGDEVPPLELDARVAVNVRSVRLVTVRLPFDVDMFTQSDTAGSLASKNGPVEVFIS